jgi:hypothetical protein
MIRTVWISSRLGIRTRAKPPSADEALVTARM